MTLQEAVERRLEQQRAEIAERERKEYERGERTLALRKEFAIFMSKFLMETEGIEIEPSSFEVFSGYNRHDDDSYFGVAYKVNEDGAKVWSQATFRPESCGEFSQNDSGYLWSAAASSAKDDTFCNSFVDAYMFAAGIKP